MKNICKNCKFWKRLTVASFYRKYFVTDDPKTVYEEYNSYSGIPHWGTAIKEKNMGDIKQNIGTCSCDKFIYDAPDTPNPHKVSTQVKNALYHCDGEEYSSFFYTGELFGCIHFKKEKVSNKSLNLT